MGEWERGAASAGGFGYQHERKGRSWGVEEDGADKVAPPVGARARERERPRERERERDGWPDEPRPKKGKERRWNEPAG